MLLQLLCLAVFVLLAVAFLSLFERNLIGLIQSRKGPNKVGMGLLQPIADAIKLVTKVETPPLSSFFVMYYLSPFTLFGISMAFWVAFPSEWIMVDWRSSCFLFLTLFSVSVFGLIFSGWFSNSNYATLGGSRAFVQSISYEVGLTLIIIFLCLWISSPTISSFISLQSEEFLLLSMSFFFTSLLVVFFAELNRSPFDLSEGESELVSGYSVEYGGLSYTLLFLGENMSIVWSSVVLSSFFNTFLFPWAIYLFVWVRATAPRVRFDSMVSLFWVVILPLVLIVSSVFLSLN